MTDAMQPKRLTLSAILEMVLSRGGERSSVSISRSASGETVIDVKVRTGDDAETATVEDAERRAREVYDRLVAAYPASASHDGAQVSYSRNAKGETQVEVSMRSSDRIPTLEKVGELAKAEYDRMRTSYPMANGLTAAPGTVR